jgi:hypothetical protein
MGPAAWAAIGRALGVAIVSSCFGGKNSILNVVTREIRRAIISNNLEMAELLLRDMAYRHKDSFEKFISKYKDSLPEEFLSKFSSLI